VGIRARLRDPPDVYAEVALQVNEDRGDIRPGWDQVPDAVAARAREAFSFRRPEEELIPLVPEASGDARPEGGGDDEIRFAHPRIRVSVAVSASGQLALLRTLVAAEGQRDRGDTARFRVVLQCADADHGDDAIAVVAEPAGGADDTDTVFCCPHGAVRLRITDQDGGGTGGGAYHTDWFTV